MDRWDAQGGATGDLSLRRVAYLPAAEETNRYQGHPRPISPAAISVRQQERPESRQGKSPILPWAIRISIWPHRRTALSVPGDPMMGAQKNRSRIFGSRDQNLARAARADQIPKFSRHRHGAARRKVLAGADLFFCIAGAMGPPEK